jgi:hypothetical protein
MSIRGVEAGQQSEEASQTRMFASTRGPVVPVLPQERPTQLPAAYAEPAAQRPPIKQIEANISAGERFKEAVRDGQKEGGKLLGTVGGVFEGVSQAMGMPFRSRQKIGLFGIPAAIISGIFSATGMLFKGMGVFAKNTASEAKAIFKRYRSEDNASAKARFDAEPRHHQSLFGQVAPTEQRLAANKEQSENSSAPARARASDFGGSFDDEELRASKKREQEFEASLAMSDRAFRAASSTIARSPSEEQ